MQVQSSAKLVTLKDTIPGDLVAFDFLERRATAIVLRPLENERYLLGILVGSEEPHPRLLQLNGDQSCVSYGNAWVLVPLGQPFALDSGERGRRAGTLALTSDGWFISIAASSIDQWGRFNSQWWNLGNWNVTDRRPRPSALYCSWQIWCTPDEVNRPGLEPLLRYKAELIPA